MLIHTCDVFVFFFFPAEDGIRDLVRSRGLGDVYKRQDQSKTFLDNSAGNGNFLVAILRRKLSAGHPPLQALSTIYGVELMPDNVEEMKDRLLVELPTLTSEEVKKARKIIDHNIVCHDALTWDYENWKSTKPAEAKPLF